MRSSSSEPVARRLSAIAGFYRYATDEDLIDRSPVAGVRRPKVADDSQTTGLDRDQLRAVLALARQRALARQLAAAGAGQSSRDLARSPCSPTTACASVRRWQPTPPTSAPSEATGCCTSPAKAAGERQSCSPRSPPGPSTTTSPGGTLARCSSPAAAVATTNRRKPAAFRLVRRLARAAGLDCAERLSPHSLRHAFVTLALDGGVSLRDVQDAAGHADPPHHPALRPGPAQPRPGSHLRRCGVPRRG